MAEQEDETTRFNNAWDRMMGIDLSKEKDKTIETVCGKSRLHDIDIPGTIKAVNGFEILKVTKL